MSWSGFNWVNLLLIPGLLVGFTIHELAHALTAYHLGDYSQAKEGKITANPFRHISWFGGILFVLFGLGWPKPISFNSQNFKNRYFDSFLVATAGPFANFLACFVIFFICLIVVGLLVLTRQIDSDKMFEILFFNRASGLALLPWSEAAGDVTVWVIALSNRIWVANFVLAVVSLIPLPPFDGFTAALSLLGMLREKRINDLQDAEAPYPAQPAAQSIEDESPPVTKKQSMADIHFRLGTEYHQQAKYDDAIARYRQAVAVDPEYGPAYVNMGLVYKAKNHRNEAIQAFRAATRYAADEKSKNQAWAELHDLSAHLANASHIPATATNNGSTPWVDTKPAPDWLAFSVGLGIFALLFICVFGLFLITMIG